MDYIKVFQIYIICFTEIKRSFMDTFTNLHLQDKEAYDFVNIPQKAKEAVANTVEQNLRFFAEGWKSELK